MVCGRDTPGRRGQKLGRAEHVPRVHQNVGVHRVVTEDTVKGRGRVSDVLEPQTKNLDLGLQAAVRCYDFWTRECLKENLMCPPCLPQKRPPPPPTWVSRLFHSSSHSIQLLWAGDWGHGERLSRWPRRKQAIN